MIGIDANVLVQFFVEDDPHQADQVHRLLTRSRNQSERVWVSVIVLCETVCVLRAGYQAPQHKIVEAVDQLLHADVFEVEEEDSVRAALDLYRAGKADFADYLIGQLNSNRGCATTVTFDRSLRGVPGFTRLGGTSY
jgi:predicted nucleic-acid-binding protein